MTDDVKASGEHFLGEYAKADEQARAILRQKLAAQLRSAAIGLGSDKATEFSGDIPALTFLTAKVAWLSLGNTPENEPFERDVHYYASFTPPHAIVAAYETFKKTTI
jgi:hypothetical protein